MPSRVPYIPEEVPFVAIPTEVLEKQPKPFKEKHSKYLLKKTNGEYFNMKIRKREDVE